MVFSPEAAGAGAPNASEGTLTGTSRAAATEASAASVMRLANSIFPPLGPIRADPTPLAAEFRDSAVFRKARPGGPQTRPPLSWPAKAGHRGDEVHRSNYTPV